MDAEEARSEAATANEKWKALGREMAAARRHGGLTVKSFLASSGVHYTPGHISNIEHGRSRPRRELVTAYDATFSPATDETRLMALWEDAHATEEAEEDARNTEQASRKGLQPVPREGPEPAQARRSRHRMMWIGGGACLVVGAVVLALIPRNPSPDEFAGTANEICLTAERPLGAVEAGLKHVGQLVEEGNPQAAEIELDRQKAAVQQLNDGPVRQLKDLDLPSGSNGEAARSFVQDTAKAAIQGLNILEDMAEKIAAGDGRAARQLLLDRDDFDVPALNRDRLAAQLGATECARIELRRWWGLTRRRPR